MINIIEQRIKNNKFVLIAEIGVNYYDIAAERGISPMEAAKLMVAEASKAGVHAVKFQTYKAETLASKDSPYYWNITEEPTDSQYKLFKKFDSFGYKEYKELANYSEKCGIEFLSTPFDTASADYLEPLMNVYKISSSDLNNVKFVEYQAKKNKPIMLSVGASNEDEIDRAVEWIKKYNDKPLTLLHCILEYPTPYGHANLNKIKTLKEKYPDLVIGYSDHTKPDENYQILQTAYILGAKVIEKHFTLNKSLKGNDHYHAMDSNDAKKIIAKMEWLDAVMGCGDLVCLESEDKARQNARRSLVAACDITQGTVITEEMLTFKRPGTGISAERYYEVIGKTAIRDIKEDEVLKEDLVSKCLEGERVKSNVLIMKTKELEDDDKIAKFQEMGICISYKCSIIDVILEQYVNIAHHAQIAQSKIGMRSSVGRYAKIRNSEIGKYCSISWDVTIGAVTHPMERASSHAFTYRKQFGIVSEDSSIEQKRTVVGNDVWIGCNSVIISGVKIGDGAVIGAGAVVTKDVEPYSIVGGVPARIIRYRFNNEICKKMQELKWWNKSDEWIKSNLSFFTEPLTEEGLRKMEEP